MLYISDDIMETCFVPDAKHHLLHQNMLLSYDIIQIFLRRQCDKSFFGKGYYVMATFQLSWHLIQVIEINAGSIARDIIYSRGSRNVFANCLINESSQQPTILNEEPDVWKPFNHA